MSQAPTPSDKPPRRKREEIVEEARRWIGTPYLHQHKVFGFGVDCLNLPRAVGEACGVLVVNEKRFAPLAAYSDQPSPRTVEAVSRCLFKRTTRPLLGDIARIAWRPGLPMHFAILGEFRGRPTLIHALATKGGVVEHGFVAEWPGLVDSWWRFPGLTRNDK